MITQEFLEHAQVRINPGNYISRQGVHYELFEQKYQRLGKCVTGCSWVNELVAPNRVLTCIIHAMLTLYLDDKDIFSVFRVENGDEHYSFREVEGYFAEHPRRFKFITKLSKTGVGSDITKEADLFLCMSELRIIITDLIGKLNEMNGFIADAKSQYTAEEIVDIDNFYGQDYHLVFGDFKNTNLYHRLVDLLMLMSKLECDDIIHSTKGHIARLDETFYTKASSVRGARYSSFASEEHIAPLYDLLVGLHANVLWNISVLVDLYFNLFGCVLSIYNKNKDKNRVTMNYKEHRGLRLFAPPSSRHTNNAGSDIENRLSSFLPIISLYIISFNNIQKIVENTVDTLNNNILTSYAVSCDAEAQALKAFEGELIKFKEYFAIASRAKNLFYNDLFVNSPIEHILTRENPESLENCYPELVKLVFGKDIKEIKDDGLREKIMLALEGNLAFITLEYDKLYIVNKLFKPCFYQDSEYNDNALYSHYGNLLEHYSTDIQIGEDSVLYYGPQRDIQALKKQCLFEVDFNDGTLEDEENSDTISPYNFKLLENMAFPCLTPGPRDFTRMMTDDCPLEVKDAICAYFISEGIRNTTTTNWYRGTNISPEVNIKVRDV